jgi:hypothetical protein
MLLHCIALLGGLLPLTANSGFTNLFDMEED